VRVEGGGTVTLQGFDEKHRLGMTFDNVHFASLAETKIVAEHANLKFGPGAVNFRPTGEDVTIAGAAGRGSPNACRNKFVPMPR
jgi:polygalacturonase